jgi:ACT domain-containing protein
MATQRLYVVHGMGSDAVGLVGQITAPIARARGNILDLRQDVLHGLFTIYLVVDLTGSQLTAKKLQTLIDQIGAQTGLQLTASPYRPVARRPERKNLLMICIGRDKPGIIASSAEMLGKHNANIELAQTIGREGIFVMELITDVSHCTLPLTNLQRTIQQKMAALNIRTIFQEEHVFSKRARVLLFQMTGSFIAQGTRDEILEQTGLSEEDLATVYSRRELMPSLQRAVAKLDGLPLDLIDTIVAGITPTAETTELLQTLKVMGYRIALASTGLRCFTDALRKRLDIDAAYGIPHRVDDDARTLVGELNLDELGSHDSDAVLADLTTTQRVGLEDVTIITDEGCRETPGIRLNFAVETLLDCFNRHVITQDNVIGLLGSFGIPDREEPESEATP